MKAPPNNALWRRRSPAEQMLLCCTRLKFDARWQAAALSLALTVDWNEVLSVAVLHQVTPLVYRNLQTCPELAASVPDEVIVQFRQALALNMQKKSELGDALRGALAFFGARQIDLLLIKGTSLDVRLYEESWLTVSQDLDLVVLSRWEDLAEDARQWIRDANSATPLIDVQCESHADLVMNGLLPLDFDSMVSRSEPRQVQGHRALLMCPEDELLCACIQSFRKRYFRLKSLCEIAEFVNRHPDLDWESFASNAAKERCAGIVYVALLAASLTLGCDLPLDLRQRLGLSRPRAAALRFLIHRVSFCSLATLYVDRWFRGKQLGRSLMLPYASLSLGKIWRSFRIVSSQAVAAP
ncbi:MAG: nucleotidyltransferase family protein [Planctomycetota bacterium]|nr:nucleotidyltransferase family protein [Planctomycetota bacterium]